MNKKYILRLDDACPQMHSERWNRIEKELDKYNIRPIVAVIPHNEDPSISFSAPDKTFWQRVAGWQNKGWYIALHGYNHVYVTRNPGIIPFNNDSEFAGLSKKEQREKIYDGLKIFSRYGIKATLWVAPSHSFDETTLMILKEETTIRIISDGIARYPYTSKGFFWIPCQIGRYKQIKAGIWTICLHLGTMSEIEFNKILAFINDHHTEIVSNIGGLQELYKNRKKSIIDISYFFLFFLKRNKQKRLGRLQ